MKIIKLKPCPFCGRSHGLLITSIHHRYDDIQWSVFCDASGGKVGCGASCGYHRTKAEAIEAWNRRAGEQMTDLEARARWVCCPMCDRKTCCFGAPDCDAKKWIDERGEQDE